MPAGDGRGLENFNRVTEQREVVGAGEAAYTGADNGDPLLALSRGRLNLARGIVAGAEVVAIGGVALESADGDGLVDFAATAAVFAGMRTDAAQDIGERIGGAGEQVGFFVPRDSDGLHISPTFGVNGTGVLAGNIFIEILPIRNGDGVAHGSPQWIALLLDPRSENPDLGHAA